MQLQYHTFSLEGQEKQPLLSGAIYVNSTKEDIQLRVAQLCERPSWNEYKIAEDFGCSKGNFSLVKRGEYGSEHGELHRYATASYRILKLKELIYTYDLFMSLQLHAWAKKCGLTLRMLAEQLYAFAASENYLQSNILPIDSVEGALNVLREYVILNLSFPQRHIVDNLLPKVLHNPNTLLFFQPGLYYFRHEAYHSNTKPHRVRRQTDGRIVFLQAADNSVEEEDVNLRGEGWTTLQWVTYFRVRLNLQTIVPHRRIPCEVLAHIHETNQLVPADYEHVAPYLPQIRSSSLAAMNSARQHMDDRGFPPSAPRRQRRRRINSPLNGDNESNDPNSPDQYPDLMRTKRRRQTKKRKRKTSKRNKDKDGSDESSDYSSEPEKEDVDAGLLEIAAAIEQAMNATSTQNNNNSPIVKIEPPESTTSNNNDTNLQMQYTSISPVQLTPIIKKSQPYQRYSGADQDFYPMLSPPPRKKQVVFANKDELDDPDYVPF